MKATTPLRFAEEPSPPPTAPTARDIQAHEVVLMAFTGLGYALSSRALLLLSLIGAFVLGWRAETSQTLASLEVLGVYGIFTIVPVTWLEIAKRKMS